MAVGTAVAGRGSAGTSEGAAVCASASAGAGASAGTGAEPAGRAPGEATIAARAFVAGRLPAARAIGAALADDLDDPGAFVTAARSGLTALADPACAAGQRLVAPGIGPTLGIRTPLLDAVATGLRRAVQGVGPARLLVVADALAGAEIRELRWLAIRILGWIVTADPERAWQLIRRLGRDADDWITVDTLAEVAAIGILSEEYRWAELEQLVYSRSRWERRLVGSTIATIPHRGHASGHSAAVITARGLALVGQLIGDDEPDVQKALSWALRELARVDPAPVVAFCRAQARDAAATSDGHRAWVLRDTLTKLPAADGAAIRSTLAGIRRAPGAPSTSIAAVAAAAFLAANPVRPEGPTGSAEKTRLP
jgi:3-methyladenine DNA glycosylase AlkD